MRPAPAKWTKGRIAATLLLILAGLLIAMQTMRMRLAEKAVRDRNGALAYMLRPQNGWGAALHAEASLATKDAEGARRASQAALEQTPYAVVALRTLARALQMSGDIERAERTWQVASSLGWRDKPTQLWAVLRAISNKEADVFAMRADALLRSPGDRRAMTSLVRQGMVVPEVRAAFIGRLANRPPWRLPFFDIDGALNGQELEGTAIALLGLKGTGAEPSRRELYDTIASLIAERRYADALRLDREFVRRTPDPGSLIDDGGFDSADADYLRNATPFDWRIVVGTATLDRSSGSRSIGVTTEGTQGQPALVRYVRLPSGAYTFRYRIQGDRESPASIGFSVACVTSPAPLGRSSPEPLAGGEWQVRSFAFAVPADCPLVLISLTPAAQSDPAVNALIDDVVISPRS